MLRNVVSRQVAMAEATKIVSDWLEQPAVACLDPTERHWRLLQEQLLEGQVSGPLATDAHLAALAVEHGATLSTTDRDFSRFRRVRSVDPLLPRHDNE